MIYVNFDSREWTKYFKRFRTRYVSMASHDGFIDPNVSPICNLFHSVSTAWVTVFSCDGHPYGLDSCGVPVEGADEGYILLTAATLKDFYSLQEFLTKITLTMSAHGMSDELLPVISVNPMRGCSEILMSHVEWYRAITVRTPKFESNVLRDKWWTMFHTILKALI